MFCLFTFVSCLFTFFVFQVEWQRKGGTYWVRYIHIEMLASSHSSSARALTDLRPLKVGDRVRVRPSVNTPQYKWGSVNHTSIGIITSISPNGRDVTVDFPMQGNWAGLVSEMERVPAFHPGVTCDGCGAGPVTGSRYKCKQVSFLFTYFTRKCLFTFYDIFVYFLSGICLLFWTFVYYLSAFCLLCISFSVRPKFRFRFGSSAEQGFR